MLQTPQSPEDLVSLVVPCENEGACKEDAGRRMEQLSRVIAEILHAQPGPCALRFLCGLVSRCSHLLNRRTVVTNLYNLPGIPCLLRTW